MGTSQALMVNTANFVIFVGVLSLGMIGTHIATGGRVDFTPNLRDIVETIALGIAFTGIMAIVTLPVLLAFGGTLGTGWGPFSGEMAITLNWLAPVGEEYLCRGFFYTVAERWLPGDELWKLIIKFNVSSGPFTIMHFWAMTLTLGTVIFLLATGYVLTFVYWWKKKLGPSIVAHFGWNTFMMHAQGLI